MRTRSKGPFQITTPVSLTQVRANTTIHFIKVSRDSVEKSDMGIPPEWKTLDTEPYSNIKYISTSVV